MKRTITTLALVMLLVVTLSTAYATAPTEAEIAAYEAEAQAYQDAMTLYEQSMVTNDTFDPDNPPDPVMYRCKHPRS